MLRSRFLLPLLCSLGFASLVVFSACSDQGEGDRCDYKNNNDDCQSGLVCTRAGSLNGNQNADVCCPQDRATAVAVICKVPGSGDGGIFPQPDSNVSDSPAVDAPAESGTDAAPTESGTDAPPTDAPPTDAPPADAPADAPTG